MNNFFERYVSSFAFLLIVIFTATAISFSFEQNLWVDESTQLSGLSLSFVDMYRWLGGMINNPFAVPADRMPVLSYYFGALWGGIFSFDVLVMRYLSLALVVISLLIISVFLLKKKQPLVLLAALLVLCLSPNLIMAAVEIRAYALFFFFSVVSILIYINIVLSIERGQDSYKQIIGLSIVLALAINTHFFGVVLSGSIIGTYILTAFFDKRFIINVNYFLPVALILSVAIVGIALPVVASFSSQGGSAATDGRFSLVLLVKPAVKLIYRLVAHQAMAGISIVPVVALAVFYAVIVVSLVRKPTLVKTSLLLLLALGFVVVFLANILLSSFDALAPHYNIWMLPVAALLFAYCIADLSPQKSAGLMVLLGACLGFGQYTLATSGAKYAHTRFDQIQQRVNQYQSSDKVAVVYNQSMAKTWFAGVYSFQPAIKQYIATTEGYRNLRTDKLVPQSQLESESDILIVAYGEDIYSQDLASAKAEGPLPAGSAVYRQILLSEVFWQVIDSGAYMAQESAEIVVYKKTP